MSYGTDISCVDDFDAQLTLADDNLALAQAIARRLITPRGAGILWGDREYGTDVRRWIGTCDPVAQLPTISAAVRAEALKDERVNDCIVEVTFDEDLSTISIKFLIQPYPANSPFEFTLAIDAVTVEILMGEAA